mgnify:CR=1 FL=1
MIRRPPRSTLDRSSAASDVYKRQDKIGNETVAQIPKDYEIEILLADESTKDFDIDYNLSLIHISEPTRPY